LSRGAVGGAADKLCRSATAAAGRAARAVATGECGFLHKQPALVERVRRDLVLDPKDSDKGRRGLTGPQVLRALVLMQYHRISVQLCSLPGAAIVAVSLLQLICERASTATSEPA
jgi:hypothetical protein